MNQVRIYHPALDRYVAVPESAVPMHRNAGWIPADEVGTDIEDATDSAPAIESNSTPADAEASPESTTAKNTSARGRRQDKEQ